MSVPVSTDSLLFNDLFLRIMMLIPLIVCIYVLLVIYKQDNLKFKHSPLIRETTNTSNQDCDDSEANR